MQSFNINTIPIIDTHVHLCFPDKIEYVLAKQYPQLYKSVPEEDYIEQQKNLPLKSFMFMEMYATPDFYYQEAKLVEEKSDLKGSKISGIIPHVPMKNDENFLTEYLNKIQHKKLVGARYLLKFLDKDDLFYLDNQFSNNLQVLNHYNLPFHLNNLAYQLPYFIKLVEKNPSTTFVLDHLGTPQDDFNFWAQNISQLSKLSNLYIKLSPGFNCEGDNYIQSSKKYLDFALKSFSYENMVVGSDYGFGGASVRFEDWMVSLREELVKLNLEQGIVEKILYKNAERIYRLEN